MSPIYNSEILKSIAVLQSDLRAGNIDQKQFDFLVGLTVQKQVNVITQHAIKGFLKENTPKQSMTFLSYVRNRQMNHV